MCYIWYLYQLLGPITDTGKISISAANIPADIGTPLLSILLHITIYRIVILEMRQYHDASRHHNI